MKINRLLLILVLVLLVSGWLFFQILHSGDAVSVEDPGFRTWFWERRALDLAVQIVLVFAGALGIAAILPERTKMTELALPEWLVTFSHVCVLLVFAIGMLCFLLRKRYIRQLVGLKLMLQSVSLGLILTGWQKGDPALAQTMVISSLVIEAVVIGLALTMIIHIAQHARDEKDFIE